MNPKRLNYINTLVIVTTFILFVAALFFKGLTHDLLLEAGVFLVSVKLIIATQKINNDNAYIKEKLNELLRKK